MNNSIDVYSVNLFIQTNQQPVKSSDTSVDIPTSIPTHQSDQSVAGSAGVQNVSSSDVSSDIQSACKTVSSSVSETSECTQDTEQSGASCGLTTASSSSVESIFKLDEVLGSESSFLPTHETPKTFKIVMDNIDKNIKPNQMREDYQTKSLHYMHKYAVRDRIDLSSFDDKPCLPDIGAIKLGKILPSDADHSAIRTNMSTLVARILVRNLPFFKQFSHCLERHVRHEFTEEMSQVSEVVSISIFTMVYSYVKIIVH